MGRPPSWNDDQLREAVAASSSFREVVGRLRVTAGGAGHRAVSVRAQILDLDTSHFYGPRGDAGDDAGRTKAVTRRRWTDDELARAVAASTSLHAVFSELGLVVGGTQWLVLRAHIRHLGLDTDHWKRPIQGQQRVDWTDEDLRRTLPTSRSYAEALRRMGVTTMSGGQYARIRERVRELGLDTSHLVGQRWARGTRRPSGVAPMPLDELLVEGKLRQGTELKRRLVEAGLLEPRCSSCDRTQWFDGPIPLEVDHINGDRRDNRLENLRLLCPNCHALTDTYRGRNIGRYAGEPPADG